MVFPQVRTRRSETGERPGAFVAVVGPSGAGKDTLIAYARQRLAGDDRFGFVRRVVTRAVAEDAEDHASMTSEAFAQAEREGAFALSWGAHGLRYGLPATVDRQIAAGRIMVANLSRAAIAALRQRYPIVEVVLVTASTEILAARLAARGREGAAEIDARLARAVRQDFFVEGAATVVCNDGPVEIGGEALVAAVLSAGERASACADH